jgi:cytidylate kinase
VSDDFAVEVVAEQCDMQERVGRQRDVVLVDGAREQRDEERAELDVGAHAIAPLLRLTHARARAPVERDRRVDVGNLHREICNTGNRHDRDNTPVASRPVSSLLVLTGPPGAGKSTVARLLADRYEPSVLVAGDAFFGFLARGAIEPWLPASHEQNTVVTRGAAAATGVYASAGYTTIYDGMVGPWFIDTFARATGLDELDYAILMPSSAVCVDRVATREGHGFRDEPATRKMHDEFARAVVDERHVIVDPGGDAADVAYVVARAWETGQFTYRPEEPFPSRRSS